MTTLAVKVCSFKQEYWFQYGGCHGRSSSDKKKISGMYRVDETKYKGLESYTGSNLALPYVSLLASVELYQVAYFVLGRENIAKKVDMNRRGVVE